MFLTIVKDSFHQVFFVFYRVALKSYVRLLDLDLGLVPSISMHRFRVSEVCFWFYKLDRSCIELAVMGSSGKNHSYKCPDIIIWIHSSLVIMKR